MSGGGHRSKFSLLPFEARYRAYALLQDGATLKALLSDPDVGAALGRMGATLNSANLTRIRKSREYQDFARQRAERQTAFTSDRIITQLLRENATLDTLGEQLKVSLLRLVDACVKGNPEDPREVERLVRSAVNLANTAKDTQIGDLKRQLREEKDLRMAEIEGRDKIIADLRKLAADRDAQIEKLKAIAGTVDNDDVIAELNESVGIT